VKVAIVDTGIDVTHPCFSDAGIPNQRSRARRAHQQQGDRGEGLQQQGRKPPVHAGGHQAHGTHVAGTVAATSRHRPTSTASLCPTACPASRRARCSATTTSSRDVEDARSEDILDALEAAYADGFDVANMSLGGGSHGVQDLLTIAVDNLDQANMVVAVAAAIPVPASSPWNPRLGRARAHRGRLDRESLHGDPINTNGTSYGGVQGEFGDPDRDITGAFMVSTGSVQDETAADARSRRACRQDRDGLARHLLLHREGPQCAGGGRRALVVATTAAATLCLMGGDDTPNQPTLPAYSVASRDGSRCSLPTECRRRWSMRCSTTSRRTRTSWRTSAARADRRGLPREARRGRPRRERAVVGAGERVRDAAVLRVLPGHVDGDPAPRGPRRFLRGCIPTGARRRSARPS
jgi:hypothetical protein